MSHSNPGMDGCIEACTQCHRTCLATLAHCLEKGGSHAEAKHIRLMMDCAQFCATHADFMLRGSAHAKHLSKECAEICRECARSCADHPDADAMMQDCATICTRCAESCEQMAA